MEAKKPEHPDPPVDPAKTQYDDPVALEADQEADRLTRKCYQDRAMIERFRESTRKLKVKKRQQQEADSGDQGHRQETNFNGAA